MRVKSVGGGARGFVWYKSCFSLNPHDTGTVHRAADVLLLDVHGRDHLRVRYRTDFGDDTGTSMFALLRHDATIYAHMLRTNNPTL